MPSERATAADEDLDIASGDVYMDPQTIEDDPGESKGG